MSSNFISRLTLALGKINAIATRDILEVLTLLIGAKSFYKRVQQVTVTHKVAQRPERHIVVKHFRYSIPAPLLE